MSGARPVRVLESFARPRATTNPYIVQLASALNGERHCELILFSFKRAILGRYDVFHVHWPEVIFTGHSTFKSLIREALTALILARIQLTRRALVRTRHNVELPSGLNRRQLALTAWFERLTTINIHLNAVTQSATPVPSVTIPHGHYKDWFRDYPQRAPIAGRIAYFGLIRRYKGVERLVARFLETRVPTMTLSISGKPSTPEIQANLCEMVGGDDRVEFTFKFLTDAELVSAATGAELVVLPYRFMHNSGATLTALSLNRPVLVPDTEVNRLLAEEVGDGWVYRYSGELALEDLESTVAAVHAKQTVGEPDLTARSWRRAGERHVQVFKEAVALVHRRQRWKKASDLVRPSSTEQRDADRTPQS
ncbi:glycosyl transferase [Microbacterium sp. STN6]|uniref:glycosyl transferase n=1 Tax=Microbacterium sp. STN6 TaxID=2995588 RepID=UPI002260A640|nr:glycosyl transferase [Microbacterium sp. STN6]MCX7523029.1 glycosyl transferase [Microbacterium sp. STN6]